MTIQAKKIDKSYNLVDIKLPDDPSEKDILSAIAGTGDVVTVGVIGPWELLGDTGGTGDRLVVGRPPYIHADPKKRISCDLKNEKVVALVKLVDDGHKMLGA